MHAAAADDDAALASCEYRKRAVVSNKVYAHWKSLAAMIVFLRVALYGADQEASCAAT